MKILHLLLNINILKNIPKFSVKIVTIMDQYTGTPQSFPVLKSEIELPVPIMFYNDKPVYLPNRKMLLII